MAGGHCRSDSHLPAKPWVHWLRTVSHSPSDPSHEVVQGCATFVENWRVHPDICRLKLEPHMRRSGDRTMVHLSLSSTASLPRSIYWDPGFRIDWAKSPRRGFSSRVPAQNARQQIHYRTKIYDFANPGTRERCPEQHRSLQGRGAKTPERLYHIVEHHSVHSASETVKVTLTSTSALTCAINQRLELLAS